MFFLWVFVTYLIHKWFWRITKLYYSWEQTIYGRMNEFDLKIRDFTYSELDIELRLLINQFPNCGEKMISGMLMLKNKGLYLQRFAKISYPWSYSLCWLRWCTTKKKDTLQRRTYNLQGSNHLWHTDTNHKLIRWQFVMIGVVDRYSRLPVTLECKDTTVWNCSLLLFTRSTRLWITKQSSIEQRPMNNLIGIELTDDEMEEFRTEDFIKHAEDDGDRPILTGLPTVSEDSKSESNTQC